MQLQKQLALLAPFTVNFAWNLSTVVSGDNRRNITLAFGQDGQPAVAYQNVTNADLAIARFDGTKWTQTIIDSAGTVGEYACLAFDPAGLPAISHYAVAFNARIRTGLGTSDRW